MDKFHSETNLADGWLYGEGFTADNLEAVKNLDEVEDLRALMCSQRLQIQWIHFLEE